VITPRLRLLAASILGIEKMRLKKTGGGPWSARRILTLASESDPCHDGGVVRRPLSLASLVESGPNRPPSDPARFTVLQLQKDN
jgi:hypothetical protein